MRLITTVTVNEIDYYSNSVLQMQKEGKQDERIGR